MWGGKNSENMLKGWNFNPSPLLCKQGSYNPILSSLFPIWISSSHWTHTFSFSFWFSLCSYQPPTVLCSFLPGSVWHPQRHFPSAGHPWALLTKNWDLPRLRGLQRCLQRWGACVSSDTAPRLSTLHSLISRAHLKGVYHVWDWFLDYWLNGSAWKQLSRFCRWGWCSTGHFVTKPGHRWWMWSVSCFLEESNGNLICTRH